MKELPLMRGAVTLLAPMAWQTTGAGDAASPALAPANDCVAFRNRALRTLVARIDSECGKVCGKVLERLAFEFLCLARCVPLRHVDH